MNGGILVRTTSGESNLKAKVLETTPKTFKRKYTCDTERATIEMKYKYKITRERALQFGLQGTSRWYLNSSYPIHKAILHYAPEFVVLPRCGISFTRSFVSTYRKSFKDSFWGPAGPTKVLTLDQHRLKCGETMGDENTTQEALLEILSVPGFLWDRYLSRTLRKRANSGPRTLNLLG